MFCIREVGGGGERERERERERDSLVNFCFTHHQVKEEFESSLVWGQSQMARGTNNTLQPCANSTCFPTERAWPGCCRTSGRPLRLHDTSRLIH